MPDLCNNCYTEVKTDLDISPNVHEVMKIENSRTSCHSPHSSDEKKLLVTQQKKLCLSCHNKDVTSNGEKTIKGSSVIYNGYI